MSQVPEYKIADNIFGTMFFGPIDDKNYSTGLTVLVNSSEMGCRLSYYTDGSKREVIEKGSVEICGVGFDPKQKENIAKSITADKGDIVLDASNGNIKLIAKNIYIESIGADNSGVFMVNANGAIRIHTGDAMTLSGDKGVCIRGTGGVNIVSDHFIKMVGTIKEGSPFNPCNLTTLQGAIGELLNQIQNSCK